MPLQEKDQFRLNPPHKLLHLEAMRGIACIAVFLYHFQLAFLPWIGNSITQGGIRDTPLFILINGPLSVYFFFALSGFVLTIKGFQQPDTAKLLTSALKRYPRLWGPTTVALMLGLIVISAGGIHVDQMSGNFSHSTWLANWAGSKYQIPLEHNLFTDALRESFMILLHDNDSYYNPNLWTMCTEFWGSIIVFINLGIFFIFRKLTISKYFIIVNFILLLLFVVHKNYWISAFFSGSMISYHVSNINNKLSFPKKYMIFLTVLFIIGASISDINDSLILLPTSIVLLILSLSSEKIKNSLSGKISLIIGKYSFPFYLVHTIIILGPGSLIYLKLQGHITISFINIIVFLCTFLISFLIATPMVYFDIIWVKSINKLFSSFSRRLMF